MICFLILGQEYQRLWGMKFHYSQKKEKESRSLFSDLFSGLFANPHLLQTKQVELKVKFEVLTLFSLVLRNWTQYS